MRFREAVLLGLIVFALPILAKAQSYSGSSSGSAASSGSSGRVFGTANCPQHVPCPGDSAYMSAPDLASSANACVTQFFGYSTSDGMFQTYTGLGGDGCLTAKPNVIPKGMGQQLTPHCCVIKQPGDYCSFHCDLITQ